ncbi:hypothetical protein AMATHDRAFT_68594 [Amanita thiersii Skay4041]|uniref:Mitochondrial glyco protein n=1 Tax=Amanita thiersii Skay4041 TaxID=703135 RepID=A0A2A9NGW5_9AGAR|nr:hypothetical protein AMATHDRAFT_68594 [Amanita thiersii Skay4041]
MSGVRALRQVSRLVVGCPSGRVGVVSSGGLVPRAGLVAGRSNSGATGTGMRTAMVWATVPRAAFSSSARVFGSGSSDVVLSQKLESEIQYEKEALGDVPATPEFLKAFEEQGVWKIEDVVGNDEVTLVRKFGNENLRMMFSIADIQMEDEADYENEEGSSEGGEEGGESPIGAYPIRVSLAVTKNNAPGALNVDMVCQDGHFMVDNISYYGDAKVGTELNAEADWKRRGLYIGPQFDTLDVGVQEEFEKFLREREINEGVAMFIAEYAAYKEQAEYVKWLKNVKTFIDL